MAGARPTTRPATCSPGASRPASTSGTGPARRPATASPARRRGPVPPSPGSLAARVAAAGRRCSLTGSPRDGWGTRGTPRQAGCLAEYPGAERAGGRAPGRAQMPGRCALPQAKVPDGYDRGQSPGPGSLAARVAAGRRCPPAGSLLDGWGTRGTPRQAGHPAERPGAERAGGRAGGRRGRPGGAPCRRPRRPTATTGGRSPGPTPSGAAAAVPLPPRPPRGRRARGRRRRRQDAHAGGAVRALPSVDAPGEAPRGVPPGRAAREGARRRVARPRACPAREGGAAWDRRARPPGPSRSPARGSRS